VDVVPKEIKAMALHSDGRHLAVGRAGGSVELWVATSNSVSSNLGWRQVSTFPGRKNVHVVKIFFWTSRHLLVASSDGSVSMLDCTTMSRTRSVDSYGETL
jgi:WD40 repeat protein